MRVRDFEGWAAYVLDSQSWVTKVQNFAAATGVDKPVGLSVTGASGPPILIQFVGGSATSADASDLPPPWTPADATPVNTVQANPRSAKEWAAAISAAFDAAGHPDTKTVQTYDQWGKSPKPAGVRVEFSDGSEVFGTVLDQRR